MNEELAAELAFMAWLKEQGYEAPRPIGNGCWAAVYAYVLTHAIITGRIHDYACTENRWCYSSREKALAALEAWDGKGEPTGWHRHPYTGRRVDETGREYVMM